MRSLGLPLIYFSGCGPIGLIAAAVAHAYSARKIIAIDNNPKRVEFAKKYISPITGKPIIDHVFLNTDLPTKEVHIKTNGVNGLAAKVGEGLHGAGVGDGETPAHDDEHETTVGDIKWEAAKKRVVDWIEEAGLTNEEGFDRVIEATGSEDCGILGVAIAKQGGVRAYRVMRG